MLSTTHRLWRGPASAVIMSLDAPVGRPTSDVGPTGPKGTLLYIHQNLTSEQLAPEEEDRAARGENHEYQAYP